MDIRVRIGYAKDFKNEDEDTHELQFTDMETAMSIVEMAVGQGYVVKAGVGSLDE